MRTQKFFSFFFRRLIEFGNMYGLTWSPSGNSAAYGIRERKLSM